MILTSTADLPGTSPGTRCTGDLNTIPDMGDMAGTEEAGAGMTGDTGDRHHHGEITEDTGVLGEVKTEGSEEDQ